MRWLAFPESGNAWVRFRLPMAIVAGWLGGTIGARQAVFATRSTVQAIEDHNLRDVCVLLPLIQNSGNLQLLKTNSRWLLPKHANFDSMTFAGRLHGSHVDDVCAFLLFWLWDCRV